METRKNFLLTDDDQDDRFLFSIALQAVDPEIKCLTARNSDEALAMLELLQPQLPDVLFLDINMPAVNGWEVLQMIKNDAKFAAVPVIMYSTSSHAGDVEKAKQLGAIGFCTKPDDVNDLKKILTLVKEHVGPSLAAGLRSAHGLKQLRAL